MNNRLAVFLLAWLLLFFCAVSTPAAEPAFLSGEKLVYRLKWAFVPAGEATLEVLPLTTVKGQPARHFLMTAKTNEFVDNFYKVRDRVEGFTDLDMTHSLAYIKEQREGSSIHDVSVDFDWEKGLVHFTEDGRTEAPLVVPPGSFDPLSVFYRFRTMPFEVGKPVSLPVTDGKKTVVGVGKVIKREKIKVPAGRFDTYLFEPDLKHIGGVFKKSKNAKLQIWFTDDERRLVVRIKSAVAVGNFKVELVRVEKASN